MKKSDMISKPRTFSHSISTLPLSTSSEHTPPTIRGRKCTDQPKPTNPPPPKNDLHGVPNSRNAPPFTTTVSPPPGKFSETGNRASIEDGPEPSPVKKTFHPRKSFFFSRFNPLPNQLVGTSPPLCQLGQGNAPRTFGVISSRESLGKRVNRERRSGIRETRDCVVFVVMVTYSMGLKSAVS